MSTAEEITMHQLSQGRTRREFLRGAGIGAAGALTVGGLMGSGLGSRLVSSARGAIDPESPPDIALVATDGYITVPGREADPLYIFGFRRVDPTLDLADVLAFKGHVQTSAPTMGFKENQDHTVSLTNLGFVQRPDLVDSHTIHWHGFDIPSPLYDGVPEVSVAVPIGKRLTYFYRPHRAGTYMWHCHFEDVEHVQMGMQGIVYVTPGQNGNTILYPSGTYCYNDGDGHTGYDRHYVLLLDELWSRFHDYDRDIQATVMTDYDPEWFTLNGRAYPQTILPNDIGMDAGGLPVSYGHSPDQDSGLTTVNTTTGDVERSQPNSSLIQANPGERILLRLANLGYTNDSMELPGIPMHVIGQDASLLTRGTDYVTDTLYFGPGEARDVILTAPAYDSSLPSASDGRGNYNVYQFKNRDFRKLSNNGYPGKGGQQTEVRVYQNPLPAVIGTPETNANQLYV
jgi:FtsP/CotA-like multicopper oxidase with cupredoxin domain